MTSRVQPNGSNPSVAGAALVDSAASASSTRSAPARTAARRSPSGSTGQTASRGAAVSGLPVVGSGASAHSAGSPKASATSRISCRNSTRSGRRGRGRAPVVTRSQQHAFRLGSARRTAVAAPPSAGGRGTLRCARPARRRGPSGSRRVAGPGSVAQPGRRAAPGAVARRHRARSLPRLFGNTPSVRCGTATISHSRPFAACIVSTCTRPDAAGTSPGARPSSRSAAASR